MLDSASAQFAATALVTTDQLLALKTKDEEGPGCGVNGVLSPSGNIDCTKAFVLKEELERKEKLAHCFCRYYFGLCKLTNAIRPVRLVCKFLFLSTYHQIIPTHLQQVISDVQVLFQLNAELSQKQTKSWN